MSYYYYYYYYYYYCYYYFRSIQALVCVQNWRRQEDEFHLDVRIDYSFDKTNKAENDEDGVTFESL